MLYLEKIFKKIVWIFDRQWDYQYIKKILKYGRRKHITCVFCGSSYVCFGINCTKREINVSLPSQDFFYSICLIKKILQNKRIDKIILGCGYYSLYTDLSKSNNLDENNRILDVYYPILKDMHNMQFSSYKTVSVTFGKFHKILRFFCNLFLSIYLSIYNPDVYFSVLHSRQRRAIRFWKNKKENWDAISEKERLFAAKQRCFGHVKQFKYFSTYEENKKLLIDLYSYCKKRKIKFYIFFAPMSKQYQHCMNNSYRRSIKEFGCFFNKVSDKFIDYNDSKYIFENSDFVDPDHMSDSGAVKLSKLVHDDFC